MNKFKAEDTNGEAQKASLIRAGQALYGDRWQTDLARDLGLSDGRRIRQWLSGDRPIPGGIFGTMAHLLKHRQTVIDAALAEILKRISTKD